MKLDKEMVQGKSDNKIELRLRAETLTR
jgi:hypothetical protein